VPVSSSHGHLIIHSPQLGSLTVELSKEGVPTGLWSPCSLRASSAELNRDVVTLCMGRTHSHSHGPPVLPLMTLLYFCWLMSTCWQ
jgi:hypothetical protein